jgi:hypothetical protein
MSGSELTRFDRTARTNVMRFAADRVCAWRLCREGVCLRARACRGDVRRCAALLSGWFTAFEAERRARPSFAAIEAGLTTPAEVKVYRAWRRELAAVSPQGKARPPRARACAKS